jgi:hypothetical protein
MSRPSLLQPALGSRAIMKKAATAAKKVQKAAKKSTLDYICERLDADKERNDGRLPHRYITKLVQDLHNDASTAWITADALNSHRNRNRKSMDAENAVKAMLALATESNKENEPPVLLVTPQVTPRNKGGRPGGTTDKNAQEWKMKQVLVTAIAAVEFAKSKKQPSDRGRLSKGSLDRVIRAAKAEVGVLESDNMIIRKETILSRIKRQKLEPVVCRGGLVTPMLKVEPILVMMCAKLASARRPIKKAQFLELANKLVQGSAAENKTIAFKAKYCGGDADADSAKLGSKYYEDFMHRNKHLLRNKPVVEQVCGNVSIREALLSQKGDNKERKKAELHKRVHAALARSNDYMVWTKDELGAMLQYFKGQVIRPWH